MTPQEKIEKLRRRQQIQAMLAIQKQQRQLLLIILPVLFKLLIFLRSNLCNEFEPKSSENYFVLTTNVRMRKVQY
jgi:hypothetical protein